MNGDELEQELGRPDQAMVDAMMSPDADRAIEIYRRAVAYGMKVPDPDSLEALAVAPASPPAQRIVRRHSWIRTVLPWCSALMGIGAIGGSLGWSYAENAQLQEQREIVLADQQKTAEQWEQLARERQEWADQVKAFEAAKIERRKRQIARIEEAIALDNPFEAAVKLATLGDYIACDGKADQSVIDQFCDYVDEVIRIAKNKAKSPATPGN